MSSEDEEDDGILYLAEEDGSGRYIYTYIYIIDDLDDSCALVPMIAPADRYPRPSLPSLDA